MTMNDFATIPYAQLAYFLRYTDDVALANIAPFEDGKWVPRGGPFGALLVVFSRVAGRWQPHPMGTGAGNSVVSSGIATNHAEANSMAPECISALTHTLIAAMGHSEAPPLVVNFSNAQSCFACQTKQEILARHLMAKGLLDRGCFHVVYGVDFDHTGQVAGFYDKPYAAQLLRIAKEGVRVFDKSDSNAVIVPEAPRKGRMLHEKMGLYKPVSVRALHAVAKRQKEAGVATPWNLRGATLVLDYYPGVLTLAEALWANAKVAVRTLGDIEEEDIPGLTNRQSLELLLQGYNSPESAIRVWQLPIESNAQQRWAELIGHNPDNQYNGAPLDPADEPFYSEVDRLFTAPVLTA